MHYVIEAGAQDGLFQGVTSWCDSYENICCILIEPHPYSFDRLKQNRTEKNILINKALVSSDYKDDYIILNEKHSLEQCSVLDIKEDFVIEQVEIHSAKKHKCPVSTLQAILEEINILEIEKLYLNVEGYESEVIKGINFNKTKIKEIEIKAQFNKLGISKKIEFEVLFNILSPHFLFAEEISPNNQLKYIFKLKNV